jgi:hypothetical protein
MINITNFLKLSRFGYDPVLFREVADGGISGVFMVYYQI